MIKKIVIFTAINIAITSCGSYSSVSNNMLNNLANGTDTGVAENPGNQDTLAYMENGMYQRLRTRYNSSDAQLANVQKLLDAWTNSWNNTPGGRITGGMIDTLTFGSTADYQPKGFEKTSLAAYRALNHIDMNNWDDARVEIKKMYQIETAIQNYNKALYMRAQKNPPSQADMQMLNNFSNMMNRNFPSVNVSFPQELSPPPATALALKNSYQSAFSHYLAGFVFEALGETSLSRPGYVNAKLLNPNNRLSTRSITNLDNNHLVKSNYTNLLIIEEVGHAPSYAKKFVPVVYTYTTPGSNQTCTNTTQLAFSELVTDPLAKNKYNYTIDNKTQDSELYTDFNLMAERHLHDMWKIMRQSLTDNRMNSRGVGGMGMGSGGIPSPTNGNCNSTSTTYMSNSVDGVFSDFRRSWVLLPAKVYLNRVQLPYGEHTIKLNVNGQDYSKVVKLNAPYQILDMRVLQNRVFFMNQQ